MDEFDCVPPAFDLEVLQTIAEEKFGISGTASLLVSERDQNARITDSDGNSYVLKIANSGDEKTFLHMQNDMMQHLARQVPEIGVPRPMIAADSDGQTIVLLSCPNGEYTARLVTFLEGKLLSQVPKSAALSRATGRFMGILSHGLCGFDHPAGHRPGFLWNLDNASGCRAFIEDIVAENNREMVRQIYARYDQHVAPKLPALRSALLHQDGNDNNLIVCPDDPEKIVGIIDFGDVVYGRQINELAVTLAYAMLDVADVLSVAGHVICGYVSAFPLEDGELDLVIDLAAMRLAMSVCISSRRAKQFPDNDYLLISQQPAFDALTKLVKIGPETARAAAHSAARNSSEDF